MVGLIAFGRPDSSVIGPKVYAIEFKPTYQTFGTMPTPATKTKPIGLPADTRAVMIFASPPRQFYRDVTTLRRLPGFGRQDSFIWTGKLSSVYRDFCKNHVSG